MKKLGAILLVVLVCCGFIPQHKASRSTKPAIPVSVLYAEAIKEVLIHQDTTRAIATLAAIFQQDPNHAPALYLLSRIHPEPERAAECAKLAYLSDTANCYYLERYGYALLDVDLKQATPIFKKLVRTSTNPNDFRILSILLHQSGKKEESIAILDSAEVRLGYNALLSRLRLSYLLDSGQTLKAEAEARKAINRAPYVTENHIDLAKIYAATGRDSLAFVSYQNAIAIDTLDVQSWLALGQFYLKKEDVASFLSVVIRLSANPTLPLEYKINWWKELIENAEWYSKHFSLYDYIIKQLRINYPENREVATCYIKHLIVTGNGEEAARVSKTLLQTATPSIVDLEVVVAIESILERPDSVAHYIDLALKHYPKSPRLLQTRSALAENRQDYDSAIDDLYAAYRCAEYNETRGSICTQIGLLAFKNNDMKLCYAAYRKAIKNFAGNDTLRSQTYAMLGDIEHKRNNMKGCYKAYDKALKYLPDNVNVLNNYAYVLSLEERKLEVALEMTTRANELSSNNPTFLDTKAWVLYKLGRYAEAKKVMQLAISLDRSKDPTYALHYGDILYALGEEFMAKVYWRKALEQGADKEEIEKRFLPQNPKEKQ